jgi:hypothetical protein
MFWNQERSLLEKVPMVLKEKSPSNELREKALMVLGYGQCFLDPNAGIKGEVQAKLNDLGYDFLNAEKVKEYLISKCGIRNERYIAVNWQVVPVSQYRKPIPEFALSKAVELKVAFPSAAFYVQELKEGPDPFLVMFYQNMVFYVEVWDEPEFEGRQIVPDRRRAC